MWILRVSRDNILTASRIVRRGGLVVYPTDTVYGVGYDPFNVAAVKRVFRVKGGSLCPYWRQVLITLKK